MMTDEKIVENLLKILEIRPDLEQEIVATINKVLWGNDTNPA
jgi:hypothetical protein